MQSNVNKLKILLLQQEVRLFNLANTRLKSRWRYNLIKISE
jgi:hypothetical protein